MTDVVDLIERDHRVLEEQLAQLAATRDAGVARRLCSDLDGHLGAEELVLYPVVATELPNGKLLAGEVEHDHAEIRAIVGRLRSVTDFARLPGLVEELVAAVEIHVDTEETEVLPQVRAVLEPVDVVALGRAVRHREGPVGTVGPGALMSLHAFALNCSLKSSTESSSTDKLLDELLFALKEHDVSSSGTVRVADATILPGVTSDEGPGDDWPRIRRQILDADIFVLGTPIWLGHPSSNAERVLERLDAFLGEQDGDGRMISADRVALVAVVGNEDGAHHVAAELFQGLNDVGFTIPANGMTYWVGEAMRSTDYRDLPGGSEKTHAATKLAAAQGAHLARLLAERPYPKV